MKLTLLSLFFILGSCYSQNTFTELTSANAEAAKSDILALFQSRNNLLAKALRLAFHDCVGDRCDGCINLENSSNAGLAGIINDLERVYNPTYSNIMTRADFWALAGIVAVEEGITLANSVGTCASGRRRDCMPDHSIVFQWGRSDCGPTSSTTETHTFPSPTMTDVEVLDYFSSNFDMDSTDTTAIMGAHTLGGAAPGNSGYRGLWIPGGQNHFDNVYYQLIVAEPGTEMNFNNVNVASAQCQCTNRWQFDLFTPDGTNAGFMLNTDMSLYKTLTLDGNGRSTCDLNAGECGAASTASLVRRYSRNKSLFINDFSRAYEKMVAHGYTGALKDLD